jgi:hypothetical protein
MVKQDTPVLLIERTAAHVNPCVRSYTPTWRTEWPAWEKALLFHKLLTNIPPCYTILPWKAARMLAALPARDKPWVQDKH